MLPKLYKLNEAETAPFLVSFKVLLGRQLKNQTRNIVVIKARIINCFLFAIFGLSAFVDVAFIDTDKYRSLMGFLAFTSY